MSAFSGLELIPAIDLRGGRCVRLFQGDFAQETVYSNEPQAVLERYANLGARRVHVVDLDGARDGEQPNRPIIAALAQAALAKLQVGGGLRTLDRVLELLDSGVERAVVGSIAITEPHTVLRWLAQLDPARIVLALDVRLNDEGVPMLTTHGWQKAAPRSLWQCVDEYAEAGITHVLCTDVGRDGAMTGPNLALYREAAQRYPKLRWQASGGIAGASDLHNLRTLGITAAISGKAMLEQKISKEELRPFLPNASSPASM